ncbi:MAG: exopolyphosphatase [Promicromonosporaceae bacterium]|nr:exopolyphosphatase [Promicromonosporaceae bacterium]
MLKRVAAIDCGTNSIRLLIADVCPDGSLIDVVRRADVVRLGQDVDRTGRFAPEALARTFAVCREYGRLLDREGLSCDAVRFVATSASRDVSNRKQFYDGVRETLGIEPEVISGDEEARLSFSGAIIGVDALPTPHLVVDLGGGSTELVLGTTAPEAAISMDVGSVRITERYFHSDPPRLDEVEAARADIRAALDAATAQTATCASEASRRMQGEQTGLGSATALAGAPSAPDDEVGGDGKIPLGRTATLVGLAGTITSITAYALGLPAYDRQVVGGALLPIAEVLAACDRMLAMTRAERAAIPTLQPGRVDVIAAGALVWAEIIRRVRAEVTAAGGDLTHIVTSEHDILDGIAASIAR